MDRAQARLTDPDDTRRVLEWLIEEERTELGEVISYQYVAEDRAGVASHPAETGRSVAYRLLKRVSYGNSEMGENPDAGGTGAFRFHLVFDYGDHDTDDPSLSPTETWPARQDPFSNFRGGFDQRCYRLCQRALMLHSFETVRDDGLGAAVPVVVRALSFTYAARPTVTTLTSAQLTGWRWDGAAYETASLPATTFTYSEPTFDSAVRLTTGLDELPNGLDPRRWQLLDLDGEGLPGLLTEQDGAWRYKRNAAHVAPARLVDLRPPLAAHPGARLTDIDGDGRLDLVLLRPAQSGHQPRTADGGWDSFRPFPHAPNPIADGPDARLIDVDGDGFADLIITEGDALIFYPSLGRDGFGPPVRVPMPAADDLGPRFLFSRDGAEVYLADMTGDGLPDVVRVRDGGVSYWPALVRGRLGAKVRMKSAPRFDHPDRFDPARLRLIDIDGTGPTDPLTLGPDACRVWMNQSGNGFAEAVTVRGVPVSLRPEELQVADLYGDGTACLVWMGPVLRPGAVALQQLRLRSSPSAHPSSRRSRAV